MFIECSEKCPYQDFGHCTKMFCTAEKGMFESFNICPYASVSVIEKHEEKTAKKDITKIYADLYL